MYLGIDIGTSAVKVALAGDDLLHVASASRPLKISHPQISWSEQWPADWWAAVVEAVQALLSDNPGVAGQVRGIGLSGQMHGAVLLDNRNKVLRPAILWNDGRSAPQCDALEAGDPGLAGIAGVRPMPGFTAPKLMWLRKHEPEVYAQVRRVLLPKDYIGWWLHGGFVTDTSDAAGTFWLDQKSRRWSDRLCHATDTDPAWLPELRSGAEVAGQLSDTAAQALGLPAGIAVAAGAGDAAAGAVALGATAANSGFISLGTSGQLFVSTDHFDAAPDRGLHSFAHCLPDLWFQMAAMLNGARPLGWFSEITGTPVAQLVAEAEAATGAIPMFLPYLTGERTPHGDADIRAGFHGLSNGTGRPEMARAVIEAIAYSFADAADAVGAVTRIPQPLLAIGGGAQSDFLLQTIADATGLDLARGVAAGAGPAIGAARLGAVATGAATISDLARPPEIERRFAPRADEADRHARRLDAFRALYPALKSVPMVP